jgi:hypothetical protein
MKLDPHTAMMAVITLGVGWVMMQAGLQKSALELRRRKRTCPSCGRHIASRTCTNCV